MTRKRQAVLVVLALIGLGATPGLAAPTGSIAMYGEPALPHDFVSLPYANPDAPKGGSITFGEVGGFDSLNPYILKGRPALPVASHVFETLMGRNWNEPFSLYGLLAESIETPEDRTWVEYTLRPEAKFSDGSPVTPEDVIWSMKTLAEKGLPRYSNSWSKVAGIEKVGERGIRFTFNSSDSELPLIIGLRPILKKADWEGLDFAASSLRVPIGSGPYRIGAFEADRYITFQRNPDYWGKDLPINRGTNNLDTIRYEYFVDSGVLFQAFTAGELSVFRELNPVRWQKDYTFPAVTSGAVVKSEIPHSRPSGMEGFVFNTRRPIFADWRVRDALTLAFNFEFINKTLNGGALPRRASYFSNSPLGMGTGPAEGRVLELLKPFEADLVPGALDAYKLPVSDGSERNRANMRAAAKELAAAGWMVKDGKLVNEKGEPFTFEILLTTAQALTTGEDEAIAGLYADALRQLGITARIKTIDPAQFNERRNSYDFDMIVNRWNMSLSPGNEQMLYWSHEGVTKPGTRNYPGVNSPAAEAMIADLLSTRNADEVIAATRGLDRVLTTGRYVIPFWYADKSLIAHRADLKFPEQLPLYGDWIGWLPDVWWQAQ